MKIKDLYKLAKAHGFTISTGDGYEDIKDTEALLCPVCLYASHEFCNIRPEILKAVDVCPKFDHEDLRSME